jgi:hypothetical protein
MIRFAMRVQYSNGKQQGYNKADSSLAVDSMFCWAASNVLYIIMAGISST